MSDRGQINTLEAFIAALLIVGALLFASQATAVTPLSASTSNQHIENQQRTMANDLLSVTAANGTLHESLTYWNTSEEDAPPHFSHNSDVNRSFYADIPPEGNPLHKPLKDAFDVGVHAYNIELIYRTPGGGTSSEWMIHMGTPSDNAVTATKTINLYDDDPFSSDQPEYDTISEAGDEFWAENVDEELALYTVVEVRLTIWRM